MSPQPKCCGERGCPDHRDPKGWGCECPWWIELCTCGMCQASAGERDEMPPEFRAQAEALRPTPQTRLRGLETETGQAAYCVLCENEVPEGPDTCLGLLPGVTNACCGHGDPSMAYVVIVDSGEEMALYEWDGLDWFASQGIIVAGSKGRLAA